jgi:hypothetical protein
VPASTAVTETPTETTLQPVTTNAASETENNLYGEHTSSVPSFSEPEGTHRYRNDPPASGPFKYPYPKTGFQRLTSKGFSSPGE